MAKFISDFSEWYSNQNLVVKGLVAIGGGGAGLAVGVISAPIVGAFASAIGLGVGAGMLSGAAASASGLAALGGGALATGGMGIAGGTAIVASAVGVVGAGTATYVGCTFDRNGKIVSDVKEQASSQQADPGQYTFD